ncbi:MAG TPA: hypothetical protein VK563_14545 [Puia sp.]|nr:hypothetical protein [Puia sp.]
MSKQLLSSVILCLCLYTGAIAQTLYVDAVKGKDGASGTLSEPLASLQQAVTLAKAFTGKATITIKISPGLYQSSGLLTIESGYAAGDTAKYTLEAAVMPDDTSWNPGKMPVISSIGTNNDKRYFNHCAGIIVARPNVCIRGLKFTGNPNPAVAYYYPIVRDSLTLNNLELSQCYFIGERNSAPIQGAVYVEGPGIRVDHCIFYGCKNAVLAFEKMKGFSLTHSIIYGAYECAVWYGWNGQPNEAFTFSDNIVSHCSYFWYASNWPDRSVYRFDHSLICENGEYAQTSGKTAYEKLTVQFPENDVRKTGTVKLVEVGIDGLPHDYLNLAPGSDGADIGAGIFKVRIEH